MTHREAICKMCRKKWNISVTRDTSKGYTCPVCTWKDRERRKGSGQKTT